MVIKYTVPATMFGSGLIWEKMGSLKKKIIKLEKIMQRNLENPTPGSNSQTFCLPNDYSKFQSLDYNCLLQIICVCTLCTYI